MRIEAKTTHALFEITVRTCQGGRAEFTMVFALTREQADVLTPLAEAKDPAGIPAAPSYEVWKLQPKAMSESLLPYGTSRFSAAQMAPPFA
jgi:hypothetical protein